MSVARLKQSADFKRLLASPIQQRSAHFAIHHVAKSPLLPRRSTSGSTANNLSTDHTQTCSVAVDDLGSGLWLGCLVPKRHARRAVTRNLIKRQMRSAAEQLDASLPPGIALLRLRQAFTTERFPSARSQALTSAVRQELEQLLQCFAAGRASPSPKAAPKSIDAAKGLP